MKNDSDNAGEVIDEVSADLENLALKFEREYDAEQSEESAEQPESAGDVANEYSQLLQGVLTPTAALLLPNWKLSSAEIEGLSLAYGELLAKYFPDDGLSNWGAEITAVLVTVTVFGSRAGVPRVAKKEKEVNPRQEKQPEPEQQQAKPDEPEKPKDPTSVDVNQVISAAINES